MTFERLPSEIMLKLVSKLTFREVGECPLGSTYRVLTSFDVVKADYNRNRPHRSRAPQGSMQSRQNPHRTERVLPLQGSLRGIAPSLL